jgi:hypothetical protein
MQTMAVVNADRLLEDRIAELDPAVRAKYRALEQDRHDASDAVDGTQRRWEESREPLMRARIAAESADNADRHDMGRIARQRHSGKPEPPSLVAQRATAALAHAEELERTRREAREVATHRFTVAQQLLAGVQDLLRRTDATALPAIMLTRRSPPAKATDVGAEIDRLRADVAKVVAERSALAVAPVPFNEAEKRLDDHLDALAAQWEPPVGDYMRPAFQPPSGDSYAPYKPIVLLANLAPLRDALHARLKAAYATLSASVPSADRSARVTDLANRQRQLELAEEYLVLESALAGAPIARRADADAAVVLCAVLSG